MSFVKNRSREENEEESKGLYYPRDNDVFSKNLHHGEDSVAFCNSYLLPTYCASPFRFMITILKRGRAPRVGSGWENIRCWWFKSKVPKKILQSHCATNIQ